MEKFNHNEPNYIEPLSSLDPFKDIVNEYIQKVVENIDGMFYEFLTENGYKIDKPYNIEQLKQIKEDLASKDLFLDYIECREFNKNFSQMHHYMIPFFNHISYPLSEKARDEIIEKWKEKNRKDK